MTEEIHTISAELLDLLKLIERAFEIEADQEYLDCARAYLEKPYQAQTEGGKKYMRMGLAQLKDTFAKYDKSEDKSLWCDYLDASYAELFLGVTQEASEPVESCYMNDERVLYCRQYFQVKAMMDEYDFEKPKNFEEPEDHIAMELKFYIFLQESALATKKADYASELLAAAAVLKKDHMDPWFGRACKAIAEGDDAGFYAAMSYFTQAALAEI